MKLIWNDLLHANFRCGRMCGDRAEHLAVNCTMPSCCARMCARMCQGTVLPLNCDCPVRFCITHRDFLYQEVILKVQIER